MVPDRLLRLWWREFNATVFEHALPRCRLIAGYAGPDTWGLCWGTEILVRDTLDHEKARATLLHEMVHQWQHTQGLRMNHGATFEQWRTHCRDITGLEL